MRDPDRINIVLEKIRRLWLHDPDIRLGQLLINLVEPKSPCPELFYLEEKELLRKLDAYSRKNLAGNQRGEPT